MKKLLLIMAAAFVLVGCGSSSKGTQVLSCVAEEDGATMKIDLEVKDELVQNAKLEVEGPYEMMGLTPELAKAIDDEGMSELISSQMGDVADVKVETLEDSLKINVEMNVQQFEDSGMVNVDLQEKVDINELKAELEDDNSTCTIK